MKELPQQCDVLVIGAGAAGLMCAITAAQRGRSVVVLDHANKVGKKILMSGGGRCNFTNLDIQPENYLSHNPHFCKSALSRYTQWDFIALVSKHGIPYHEKTLGQLFCDNKSSDILNMLLSEAESSGVDIQAQCEINKIEKRETGFSLATSFGSIVCASLVVACGGKSIPTMGATGFGYQIAKQFDLKLYPTRAGLVPFRLKQALLAEISEYSGASLNVVVSSECGQSFKEAMLITHRGLSGPAILQISSYWQEGESVSIDLLPEVSLHEILREEHAAHSKLLLHQIIAKFLPKKLAQFFSNLFLSQLFLKSHAIAEYSLVDLKRIAEQFHGWCVIPENTEGYRTAEVTLGGLDTDELSSKTMEVKKHPRLYFIGEVLDVTGHLGGYNFQWAWSSGYAAGLAV